MRQSLDLSFRRNKRPRNWSICYYLCSSDDVLWRIPDGLHKRLVAGTLVLRQFAGTKQRVLEVHFRRSRSGLVLLGAYGSIYSFAADGKLDLHAAAEAAALALEGSRPRRVQEGVIDVGPAVRARRWTTEQTWRPSPGTLRAVRADLHRARNSSRVPVLKRMAPE
jgi:hypothetical protein